MQVHTKKRILVFDTDMGTDDALAYAIMANTVQEEVYILTSFGNVSEIQACTNARILNHLKGMDWKVFRGSASPISGEPKYAHDVHGADGLGGATYDISEITFKSSGKDRSIHDLAARLSEYDNVDISWLSTGPATNLAFLCEYYRDIFAALDQITLMSGSFFDFGNVTSSAEFNAFCDPDSLMQVLRSGKELTFVPLDVCRKLPFRYDELDEAFSVLPMELMRLLRKAHYEYAKTYKKSDGFFGCYPHDSIAFLACKFPEIFYCVEGVAECDIDGEVAGQTRVVTRVGGPHKIAMGVDIRAARGKISYLGKE